MIKRFLKVIVCSLAVIMSFGISACQKNTKKNIEIKTDEGKIDVFEGKDVFEKILKEKKVDDLKYIKNGKKIELVFKESNVKEVKVKEHILKENGGFKYPTEEEGKEVDLDIDGNNYSFLVKPNYATLLSSDGKDYDKGSITKGYSIEYTVNATKKDFSFVIKGDAAVTNLEQ